jgi:hypothetical protein
LGGDFNIDRIKKAGVENYLYEKVLLEGFIDVYAAAAIDPLDELCEDKDNPDEHCTIGVTDLGDSNPGRIDYIFAKDFRKVTNSQIIFNSAITDDPAVSDHSAVSVSLASEFEDIPPGYWAEEHIYKIYEAGITAGCSQDPLMYCPEDAVTRAQMAVFLERGINGSDFNPSVATGVFDDCPVGHWAADWIEQFYADGITSGCSQDPLLYCPDDLVTRAQMAVFLLRSMYGNGYTPPSAAGIFDDVPVTHWAANWIEQLYDEGITGGCSTDPPLYCPDDTVTRAQMAVFIVRAFDL